MSHTTFIDNKEQPQIVHAAACNWHKVLSQPITTARNQHMAVNNTWPRTIVTCVETSKSYTSMLGLFNVNV